MTLEKKLYCVQCFVWSTIRQVPEWFIWLEYVGIPLKKPTFQWFRCHHLDFSDLTILVFESRAILENRDHVSIFITRSVLVGHLHHGVPAGSNLSSVEISGSILSLVLTHNGLVRRISLSSDPRRQQPQTIRVIFRSPD